MGETHDAGLGVRDLDVTAAVVAALQAGSLTSDFNIRFTGNFANQLAEYGELGLRRVVSVNMPSAPREPYTSSVET